ncbi:MAG: VanZ family protein [Gammaproteobacteria bacterium]|nr:VanZ family protein [Gammaproteobacteria bacterium]
MKRNFVRIMASAVIVALLLVIHFATPSLSGLWLQTLYDSLHVPLFGIIAVCALLITPPHWPRRKRLLAVLGAVVGLSALSEIAQIPTARDASLSDLLADFLGAAGFIAVAIVFSTSISVPKGRGRYLVVLGFALIFWPLLPLTKVSAAYLERSQLLPELISFDSRFGDMFFYVQNAEFRKIRSSAITSYSAEVSLGDGPWPGIIFHDLWPNWEPYSNLTIEIENPGAEPLPVNIRVHDRAHRDGDQPYGDRFNRSADLAPGTQTIRIALADIQSAPSGRQMNMAEIDGLVVFCTQQESGRKFVLHNIRLE